MVGKMKIFAVVPKGIPMRLIDADVLIVDLCNRMFFDKDDYIIVYNRIQKIIRSQPSIQPNLQCKNCKHWVNNHLCKILSKYGTFETKADFYCGYAEKR